jgi:hypothetical protein
MRLSPRLLSLVAGSATLAATSLAGCGGTVQRLSTESAPSTTSAPRVASTPRVTPTTTNTNATPSEAVITTVGTSSSEPMNPEDYPVDCGRG